MRWIASLVLLANLAACEKPTSYDLVIANGRVMDPESGLDAVRHIGITVATASRSSPRRRWQGTRVIDAANHVVAPGFVDLHEHGQQEESYRMMVRDGVTSALELEVGTGDIAKFYDDRKAGQIVNYGASIRAHSGAHESPRRPEHESLAGRGRRKWESRARSRSRRSRRSSGKVSRKVRSPWGSAMRSTPGASMDELHRMFKLAAAGNASVHIRMRNGVAGLDSTIALAKAAGAKLHIVHVNSSGDTNLVAFLESHPEGARGRAGRNDRSVSLRRRDDVDPVGAVRRLEDVA